ncbi:hypothetical protein B0I35DRAFT_195633 [Stachybotrys elegans]|uniref:Zn(2)-C6 fungal-type domain-containing protein n=1 Tax=Stachybotrys elegans TaxID=80388 RepID=A0A8K0SAW2_9HYPO|nr:hypothetical protein B0I35DRAFT_195633 [Stachybotrys elegans]
MADDRRLDHPQMHPPMAQAAPRQRASIACRYCRKRKVRCNGYQSVPGGKCKNCARMNQDCVFQPALSSTSTAFVPVSAIQSGVPLDKPRYGAYGQLLNASNAPLQQPNAPSASSQAPGAQPQHGHCQPMHSPTEGYASYGDHGGDGGSQAGRRRRGSEDEREEGYRLPPLQHVGGQEDDPRRRSPAELSIPSSPGGASFTSMPPARYSPRNSTLPYPQGGGPPPAAAPGGSNGGSTPARHAPTTSQPQQSTSSAMNLSSIVDRNDIDKGMINRLNRPGGLSV